MKKTVIIFLITGLCISIATEAMADKILLRKGRSYEGLIVSENNDTVVMEVPFYPIRITVYKGAIKEILRGSEAENARLRDAIANAKRERGFIE